MIPWDRKTVPVLAKPGLRLFEADRLTAYQDGGGVWTIGTGFTRHLDGTPVRQGDRITQAQDDAQLDHEITTIRMPAILRAIPATVPLTDAMAAMLISLDYEEGVGVLAAGNVITQMLAAGLLERAFAQGLGWCVGTANGVRGPQLGILRRRQVERLVALGAPLHPTYEQVWRLGTAELLPLYQQACADAAAWRHGVTGWEVHPAAAAPPVIGPAGAGPGRTTSDCNDASLASIKGNRA